MEIGNQTNVVDVTLTYAVSATVGTILPRRLVGHPQREMDRVCQVGSSYGLSAEPEDCGIINRI
jgi:hypothetical protein